MNVKYIYNPWQARFYIQHGVKPIDSCVHEKTKKVFWAFKTDESEEVYNLWCEYCNEYKRNKRI